MEKGGGREKDQERDETQVCSTTSAASRRSEGSGRHEQHHEEETKPRSAARPARRAGDPRVVGGTSSTTRRRPKKPRPDSTTRRSHLQVPSRCWSYCRNSSFRRVLGGGDIPGSEHAEKCCVLRQKRLATSRRRYEETGFPHGTADAAAEAELRRRSKLLRFTVKTTLDLETTIRKSRNPA